jgi:2-keto-4-pentenoate hydratase/2-oxohepta-3-ene-1,7-dioic acid hydratase in catechol pathway
MDECKYPLLKKPGKIICVGLNYPPAGKLQDWFPPPFPVLFHKPSSSLVGSGKNIILPKISQKVLYEGELAIVIGALAKNVSEINAFGYIFGYTIANDVGAADIEERSSQWASGKMFDTFCPVGPRIVPHEEIGSPAGLDIVTRLNDQVVQTGNTSEMIFGVAKLVSYISGLTTLEEGDIILSGSPKRAGNEPDPRIPLQPGDTVEISIERIGSLVNTIVLEGG